MDKSIGLILELVLEALVVLFLLRYLISGDVNGQTGILNAIGQVAEEQGHSKSDETDKSNTHEFGDAVRDTDYSVFFQSGTYYAGTPRNYLSDYNIHVSNDTYNAVYTFFGGEWQMSVGTSGPGIKQMYITKIYHYREDALQKIEVTKNTQYVTYDNITGLISFAKSGKYMIRFTIIDGRYNHIEKSVAVPVEGKN